MIFNSLEFAVFLAVVLLVIWRLDTRGQNRFLLLASYLFYGYWDWRFLALIGGSTAVDYLVGRALGRYDELRVRRRLLVTSLAANLGSLATFKYLGFFADSLKTALGGLGAEALVPSIHILLPVGISFYTFQSMSYTIDVYRGRLEPVRDPVVFALYVAYFPQLVAGPIERAGRLLPQLQSRRRRPASDEVFSAIGLIGSGLLFKVAIADQLAGVVQEAFDQSETASWHLLVIGVYAFALQIYADFAGYSRIARGVSRLLGIELLVNFRTPYLAESITDFWRRWHISLSDWLRDYLYIPLGGNRGGSRRTYRNLMLTMLLGGLWHGSSWTFVIWGGLHGGALAVERYVAGRRDESMTERSTIRRRSRQFSTFHVVCLAWVFFRAETLGQAWAVITGITSLRSGEINRTVLALVDGLLPAAFLLIGLEWLRGRYGDSLGLRFERPVVVGAAVTFSLLIVAIVSGGAPVPFVYFQF